MYLVSLIGRLADSVADIPYSAAQNCIMSGTHRIATEEEIALAGLDPVPTVQTADPARLPPGYVSEVTEDGGYDVRDPAGLPINIEPLPNLPAAISAAHEHLAKTVLPEATIAMDQLPPPPSEASLADYRIEPVEGGGFNLFDPAGLPILRGENEETVFEDEESARAAAREHFAATLGITLEELDEQEAAAAAERRIDIPENWQNMHHTQRRALAVRITGEPVGTAKKADEIIEEYATRPV